MLSQPSWTSPNCWAMSTGMARLNQTPDAPLARLPVARNINFAKRLTRLMAERELSQSGLAAKMWGRRINAQGKNFAIGKDRVSKWLKGANFPDRDNLGLLAKTLKVAIEDLVPEAELTAGRQGRAEWSIAKARNGLTFVRIAQYVPDDIAHKIHGLLLEAKNSRNGDGKPNGRSH